jgi:hypothetical protein
LSNKKKSIITHGDFFLFMTMREWMDAYFKSALLQSCTLIDSVSPKVTEMFS